jgi:hypothetical protein
VLKHTIEQQINTVLAGSIVEDVCIVPNDPRYQPPPAHGCGDTALPVNNVCPGFDNTGGGLVIPGFLCGHAGSNSKGFALIKTLTSPDNYDQTYVENAATVDSLLSGPHNPFCGPPLLSNGNGIETFAWAPLANEGTLVETNNMVDITTGCGTSHGGTTHASLWAVGLALDTTASELTLPYAGLPLDNFASAKYTHLTGTITSLTPNNIGSTVSTALWNNSTNPPGGCIGQSWTLFKKAATEAAGPQQTADFQNAANLLTNADGRPASNITCDSIVTNNLSTGQFIQTTNTSPPVLNPSGQVRSRLANLYYSINTLILGNSGIAVVADSTWPPAVSVNIDPPTTGINLSTTLRWNISASVSGCSLTSSDGTYHAVPVSGSNSTVAAPRTFGTPVSYIITCTTPAVSATAWATATHHN